MKILCINTAFIKTNLAFKDEKTEMFEEIKSEAKNSETVLPAIERMLFKAKTTPKKLSHIAVVVGPGSFTGIRIGTAIAKGFACVSPTIKLIAINSLDLMAYEFLKINSKELKKESSNLKSFFCIQNAFSKRFFISEYNFCGEKISESSLIENLPKNQLFIKLKTENFDLTNFGFVENIELKPESLLEISLKYIENNKITELQNFEPTYIRLSQAEENLKNLRNN